MGIMFDSGTIRCGKKRQDDEVLQGSPTFGYNDYSKSYVHFKKFTENRCRIRRIKKQILNQKRGIMVKQKTIKTEISLTGVGLHR
jgi:hypothetical protein